jgi:tripartite-type tricarboxylate transporter receptor subunit TctC
VKDKEEDDMLFLKTKTLVVTATLAAMSAWSYQAANAAEFYKDQVISMVIATGHGGGYQLVSQLLQRHLPRHIPGEPAVVLNFMPGAGGSKAANYFYTVAPRNGYTIGMMTDGVALTQALRSEIKYDASKFNSIGRMMKSQDVFVVMQRTGASTLEKARKMPLVMAGTGKSSVSYMNAALMKNLLGFNFKIVLGYSGTGSSILAMDQKEVDGYVWAWPTIKQKRLNWLKDGTIKTLAQVGLERSWDLKDVPLVSELTDDPKKKAVLEFMASKVSIGRGHTTPPNFPKAQLAVLRSAYMAMVKDQAFLAEAKKRLLDIDPLEGAKVQAIVNKVAKSPPGIVTAMKKALDYK